MSLKHIAKYRSRMNGNNVRMKICLGSVLMRNIYGQKVKMN